MTPEEREERIRKAPRWVQDEIRRLQYRVEEAEKAAAFLTSPVGDGYVDPHGRFPVPVVPPGQRVRYPLDGLGGHRWIDVRRVEDGLEIMASSRLAIRPQVTNVVVLEVPE